MASKHGGVNPAIAYAQSAKETGYGRFGGVLDESYKNPCGLKITSGGDDKDPNAHQRFASWEDGISAHLDHLALYAGASGYPRTNTLDPRHFSFLFGIAKTLEELKTWAPSDSNYGIDIANLVTAMETTVVPNPLNKLGLDFPSTTTIPENRKLKVTGWSINVAKVKNINVYLDNKYIGQATYGINRPDINAKYPGYPDGDKSGYEYTIDSNLITTGKHVLMLESVGIDGSKVRLVKDLNAVKLPDVINVDGIRVDNVDNAKNLIVHGWALTHYGISKINTYVDDKLIGSTTTNIQRNDVASLYPQYPNSLNSGFYGSFSLQTVPIGKHNVTLEFVGADNSTSKITREITISKVQPYTNIDYLTQNLKSGKVFINLSGWAVNASGVEKINIYADNKFVGNAQLGISRPDVGTIYPGHTESIKSGFYFTYDITSEVKGQKNIVIEVVGKDGSISKKESTINTFEPQNILCIDYTNVDSLINGRKITVGGWALHKAGVKQINFYQNEKLLGSTVPNIERRDVDNIYPGYPGGIQSGYFGEIDLTNLAPGNYTFTVEVVGNDGTKVNKTFTKEFTRPPSIVNLDFFSQKNEGSSIKLNMGGWAIDPSGIEKVNLYLDGKLLGNVPLNIERPDVVAAFPVYKADKNSGFFVSYDITNETKGLKKAVFEVVGKDGNIRRHERTVMTYEPSNILVVDYAKTDSETNAKKISFQGWALNKSGVKSINVYYNNTLLEKVENIIIQRPDVDSIYPGFINGINSGYLVSIDANKIQPGKGNFTVEAVGNDGTIEKKTVTIDIKKPESIVNVDLTKQISTIAGKQLYVAGWAVNASGVSKVTISIDSVYENASIGGSRPDVGAIYPQYNESNLAGFSASLNINGVSGGIKNVVITVVGKDGSVQKINRTVLITKLPYIMNLDSPNNSVYVDSEKTLNVRGWSLSEAGIGAIDVYLANKYVGRYSPNVRRPDVIAAYPGYTNDNLVGFSLDIDISKLPSGTHLLDVYTISNDNHIELKRVIINKKTKLIMIDPGHGGSDPGAVATHNGIKYEEAKLNLAIAHKVKSKLEGFGYSVVMTRTDDKYVGLEERSQIANSINPVFFLSLHHDSFDLDTANGSSSHYSTYRPNIDREGLVVVNGITYDTTPSIPAQQSGVLAPRLAESLSSVGFRNRGASDHNLSVTRNTNMASVLVECGFITSPLDIRIITDPFKQELLAQNIASTIYNYYK